MKNVGICFSTRERVELSRQSIATLLQPQHYDTWWVDGSDSLVAVNLPDTFGGLAGVCHNVCGGADSAIVYALTLLLEKGYEYCGLAENDVLVHPDWFNSTFALFERGRQEGLEVGAVSPRAYEDRILCQRDGYALMHNIGAGFILFTRRAAELVLQHFRTGATTDNRRVFMQLSGLDIGRWWAFRAAEHMTCADWQFDRVLAQHGFASLALTPSPVEMIGQVPSLHEQGLKLVGEPVELLRNDVAFATFCDRTRWIRNGEIALAPSEFYRAPDGTGLIFPHQIGAIGGSYAGDWKLKWKQGYGPFAWEAVAETSLQVPVSGSCAFIVSGGEAGGKIEVVDEGSGYRAEPDLLPEGEQGQVLSLVVPAAVSYRNVRMTALTPSVRFLGLHVREPQMTCPQWRFDHSILPSAG